MKQIKQYFPFIFAALIISVMLSSCVATEKQKKRFLAKHCQRNDSSSYISKDSIVYKDSLINIPVIVSEPIYLENPCKLLCDSLGRLKPYSYTKTSKGITSGIKTVGNVLIFTNQVDSLTARIRWLENHKTIKSFSHTENVIEKPCEFEHRTKFDGFTYWWFFITACILLLILFLKLAKTYLKAYLPFLR